MLAADNIVPVFTDEVAEAYGDDFIDVLDQISATITTEDLTEANARIEIDGDEAEDLAADFLEEHDLA